MNENKKSITIFTISFIVAFFIVGYVLSASIVEIHWVEDAAIWNKFREYYLRNVFSNIIISLIIAGISTIGFNLISRKKQI